ncbi:hypothetical protein [Stappia stellulata]|nr:hypothetical protein [Stappia stellulata]
MRRECPAQQTKGNEIRMIAAGTIAATAIDAHTLRGGPLSLAGLLLLISP